MTVPIINFDTRPMKPSVSCRKKTIKEKRGIERLTYAIFRKLKRVKRNVRDDSNALEMDLERDFYSNSRNQSDLLLWERERRPSWREIEREETEKVVGLSTP